MKTERVTILAAPAFKAFLTAEAEREGLSVGELVRRRCERRPTDDDATLAALAAELTRAVHEARRSLQQGLAEAQAVLADLAAVPGARRRVHPLVRPLVHRPTVLSCRPLNQRRLIAPGPLPAPVAAPSRPALLQRARQRRDERAG